MTNQEIKTVGQTIAAETQIGGNTAARVGGVVEGIGVALDNKDAANGYYQATINGGTISVNAPNFVLGTGGNLRLKMPAAGTTASTLTIGNANAVQLWYNGAAVSADNSWEAGEIVTIFYDGTRFMASNSQGGGGKAEKIKYDNSQSGLSATNVQDGIDELSQNVDDIFGNSSRNSDFGIVDGSGNLLTEIVGGHIKTKYFNSAEAPAFADRASVLDFAIQDDVGQDIVQFLNGHIKTKNFYSADILNQNLRGKKVSIIGDSISTFSGYIPSGYATLYPTSDVSVNTVNKTWWYQVIQETGMELGVDAAWSGCKLTLGGDANSTTNAYVACSPKRIADVGANGTPDIILCFVGTNDFGYRAPIGTYKAKTAIPTLTSSYSSTSATNNFADAYAVMIDRLRTAYPSARIFCMTLLDRYVSNEYMESADSFPCINNAGFTVSDYNDKIKEICANMGVGVIDTYSCGIGYWNEGTYLKDHLHPNAAGMQLISKFVIRQLSNNY